MDTFEWFDKSLWDRIDYKWGEKEMVYARLKTSRETIQEFFRPDMDTDVDDAHDANLLGHDIYEGTAPWAAKTMAIGYQSHQFSKALDWIDYQMAEPRLRGIDELDGWCRDIRDHNSEVYKHGNFYDVQRKYTLDAVTFGSPVNFGEEDLETGEIMWIPQHFSTYRLFYDRFNRPEGIIIKDKSWTVKMIYDKFCPGRTKAERLVQADKFSTPMKNDIEGGRWGNKHTITRALFRWDDPIWYNVNGLPKGGQKWVDCYFEDKPRDKNKPLEISGYFTKPFVVWDYDKNRWESAARTPAYEAIYDNVTLQQIFLNFIENVQMKVRPPMKYLKELKGQTDFGPGGLNEYERSQWNFTPEPIKNVGDLRFEVEQIKMLKEHLQRHFHTNLFNILTEIALTKNQPLSATQILEIAGEKITMLAPMMESNDKYLRQVDERVCGIEIRAGRGPFAPEIRESMGDIIEWHCRRLGIEFNGEVVPEFVGELRRTQQMKQNLKPLRLGLAIANEIRETIDPDVVAMAIRSYETLEDGLKAVNFPMKNLKPKDEYEESQRNLNEAREKDRQQNLMIEAMKAAKGMTKAMEPNSPAALMTGQK